MTEYEIAKNAINNLLNSETSKQEIELAILVEYMSLLKEKHEISKRITVIKTELDEIHEKMSETRFFSYNDHNEVTLLHNLDETGVDLRDDEDDYTHYGLRKLVNNIPKKMTMPLTNFKSDKKVLVQIQIQRIKKPRSDFIAGTHKEPNFVKRL